MARYECECGATGYRAVVGIKEHRSKLARNKQWTARDRRAGLNGRITPRIDEDFNTPKERDE
jgi:hypothetical protein